MQHPEEEEEEAGLSVAVSFNREGSSTLVRREKRGHGTFLLLLILDCMANRFRKTTTRLLRSKDVFSCFVSLLALSSYYADN